MEVSSAFSVLQGLCKLRNPRIKDTIWDKPLCPLEISNIEQSSFETKECLLLRGCPLSEEPFIGGSTVRN